MNKGIAPIGLAENRVERLYSYVLTHDSGFAPNPHFGICTLACCKPHLRRSIGNHLLCNKPDSSDILALREDPNYIRQQNIWVIGLAGKLAEKRLGYPYLSVVYVMQVTGVLDFRTYYQEHPEKRPCRPKGEIDRNNPDAMGDAIYDCNDPEKAKHLRSEHFEEDGYENDYYQSNDLSGKFVLLSDHFIYFEKKEYFVPGLKWIRDFRYNHPSNVLVELENLLNGDWRKFFNNVRSSQNTQVTLSRGCKP